MSDEQREQGRDESAPADASPTQQHPVPAPLGGPAPSSPPPYPSGQPSAPYQPGAAYQPGSPYQPAAAYPAAPPASPWSAGGASWGGPEGRPSGGYGQQGPVGAPGASTWPGLPAGQTGPGAPPPPPGAQASPDRPRGGRGGRAGLVVAALLAGLVGGGAAGAGSVALFGHNNAGGSGTTLTQTPATTISTAAAPGSVAAAAAKAMPSTVDIQVNLTNGSAEGSGIVLTADGDVLTNNHVVEGAQGAIGVTLADGSEHTATVLGTSPSYDLAVIKLQGVSGLTPATLGQTSDVQVGQQVVAIGSPQGLTGTVTDGIVSALNRTVAVQSDSGASVVYNGLQTDAAINPGNSGGPLVNLDGQVVGVNSAIATASSSSSTGQGGSIGLGFAIPVDQAKRVAQEIMSNGSATKPVLGVAGSVNSAQSTSTGTGAQISTVSAGSPAATAGLKAGDVVTKVGSARVEDFADLIARIGSNAPGAKVALTVGTGSTAHTVEVTLGSQKDNAASTGNGGESTNPFGRGGQGQGQGQGQGGTSPFGNQSPFGNGN